MSMISRYQKSGGFIQLLKLIETSGKQKQENFINIIDKEDSRWAIALRQRMLSIEKILSWEDNVLAEIFSRVNELTLSTAIHGFNEEQWTRMSKTFSSSQIRRIMDLKNSRHPNAGEISAAYVKVLEDVRSMISDGSIKAEKIAPELVIGENIEERIMKGEFSAPVHATIHEETRTREDHNQFTPQNMSPAKVVDHSLAPHIEPHHGDDSHLKDIKHKLVLLANENATLKSEVKVLKERLGQIKKLSA